MLLMAVLHYCDNRYMHSSWSLRRNILIK